MSLPAMRFLYGAFLPDCAHPQEEIAYLPPSSGNLSGWQSGSEMI